MTEAWQQALIGLPMATFLGVQALMFRRMMNTYQKSDVDNKVNELKESIDRRFEEHGKVLNDNTEALHEVAVSLAVLSTKLEERT